MGLKTKARPNQLIKETSSAADGGEFVPGRELTISARLRPLVEFAAEVDGVAAAGELEVDDTRFWFAAEISSTVLDAYFTHMDASTLRNFAQDSAEGVSLLDSHDGYKLGVGYSAGGRFEEENGVGRAVAIFYIVPGINFGGKHSFASTDDYIRAVEAGVVRDVSVGFHGGRWVCDLCHQPYYGQGTTCNHIAGWEYEIERAGKVERETCTVSIIDARLSEVSLVYDGATPGAMILKAEQEAEAGRLSPEMVRQIETQYRVKLPKALAGTFARATTADTADTTIQAKEDEAMEEELIVEQEAAAVAEPVTVIAELVEAVAERIEAVAEPAKDPEAEELRAAVAEIRGAVAESAAPGGIELAEAVRWLNEQLAQATQERDTALQSVAELQPLADQGRAYRAEMVDQAVLEGMRALGEAFPEETYRAMLAMAPLEHIRQVRDTFAKQAAERFPGGRQTRDKSDEPVVRPAIPAAAYGVK